MARMGETWYIKGFNNGYYLTIDDEKRSRHLFENIDLKDSFYQGLLDGKAHALKEKAKEFQKQFEKEKGRSNLIEKDREK